MSNSSRRSDASHRFGISHVLAGWVVALVLALIISADLVATVLVTQNLNADEAECRRREEKADAARKASAGQDNKPITGGEDADPYYKSREYCIARRSAIAGEQQASFAKGQVYRGIATLIVAALAAMGALLAAARARQTVETMQDTAKRELRAYLAAVPYKLTGLTPTDRPRVSFKVTNHGTTPAHRMSHAAVLRVEQHPLPANFPFPALPAPSQRPGIAVLHPDSAVPYIGHYNQFASFSCAEIIEILRGHEPGQRLYVFGQIDYVDAFGKPRWTRFCCSFIGHKGLVVAAQGNQWGTVAATLNTIEEGRFELANQHNETDDDNV